MSRRNRQQVTSNAKDSDKFRGLVDRRISVDEYVKHLDQRVHDRADREERPAPAAPAAADADSERAAGA